MTNSRSVTHQADDIGADQKEQTRKEMPVACYEHRDQFERLNDHQWNSHTKSDA